MVPFENLQGDLKTTKAEESVTKSLENGSLQPELVTPSEQALTANGKAKFINGPQTKPNNAGEPKEGKMSGKEAKDKAKAEKAARRAREKGNQQGQPVVDFKGGNSADTGKPSVRRGSEASGPGTLAFKHQHKRNGSTTQKALPLRPMESNLAPKPVEPKKEDKRVALFDHLYGHPRRNTLAGAGKDVHPAVLALGLQMSSYVICGSNARCVSMLLVFKRVGLLLNRPRM